LAEDAFVFVRGTFYRWAQRIPSVPQCRPHLLSAPMVIGVGDAHAENFGTWLSDSGTVHFGVNDFDEAAPMPYTNDLIRLAASALLGDEDLTAGDAARFILRGYKKQLERARGRAVKLSSRRHRTLFQLATSRAKDPEEFWGALEQEPRLTDEEAAMYDEAIAATGMEDDRVEAHRRTAGCGSLGRVRVVLLTEDGKGQRLAQEAKRLLPSAWLWATRHSTAPQDWDGNPYDAAALALAGDARDPAIVVEIPYRYVSRELSPLKGRLPLGGKHRHMHRDEEVLGAMGASLAVVHERAGSHKAIRAHLRDRPDDWLKEAADAMARDTRRDYEAYVAGRVDGSSRRGRRGEGGETAESRRAGPS
jgi:hypothetical protein